MDVSGIFQNILNWHEWYVKMGKRKKFGGFKKKTETQKKIKKNPITKNHKNHNITTTI